MGRKQRTITGTIAGVGLALTLGEFIDALTRYDAIPDVPWIQLVYAISIIAALLCQWSPVAMVLLDRDQNGRIDAFEHRGADAGNSAPNSADDRSHG